MKAPEPTLNESKEARVAMTERQRELRRRRHRKEKRRKLRAKLAKASGQERAAIEAKIEKTYYLIESKESPRGEPRR